MDISRKYNKYKHTDICGTVAFHCDQPTAHLCADNAV